MDLIVLSETANQSRQVKEVTQAPSFGYPPISGGGLVYSIAPGKPIEARAITSPEQPTIQQQQTKTDQ
jgi:hypothetical protein